MFQVIITILIGISGICWSIVYIECIRNGFKQKTYCMPLFVLALNFAWEGIYAYTDLFIRHNIGAQAIANSCWFILDIFIVITWLKYGRKDFTGAKKKFFIPWTLLVIITAFVLQILFIYEFGNVEGEKYSAYLQNIAMSLSFLALLDKRKSSEGQTMTIAICKCIGTLTPTIYGALEGNMFILISGAICFIFDFIYIGYLYKVKSSEKRILVA
ncbi:MAG TPA: hypothetical protein IAC41_02985 [Candidatus Merdenecus merdavium]|nr:hypothetical protein [Candidatus Merdenecus merdavium]